MTNRSSHTKPTRARSGDGQPRAWQRMLSGRRLDLLDPSPLDIEVEDIAHGLARVARWNGQTVGDHAMSVAQHALVVEDIAAVRNPSWDANWRLAALLHDSAEYVVGDLISPFKNAIGLDYKAFETRLLEAIHHRFGLPKTLPQTVAAEIKTADRIAAYFEATALAGFGEDEALEFFGTPEKINAVKRAELAALEALSARVAQRAFLDKFSQLFQTP